MDLNVGLWIDHRKAIVVSLDKEDAKVKTFDSEVEARVRMSGGSRSRTAYGPQDIASEKQRDERLRHQLNRYYDKIIRVISEAENILIMGPGEAKYEFKKRLERSKRLSLRVVGVEVTDRMTEEQILAKVKEYFSVFS